MSTNLKVYLYLYASCFIAGYCLWLSCTVEKTKGCKISGCGGGGIYGMCAYVANPRARLTVIVLQVGSKIIISNKIALK